MPTVIFEQHTDVAGVASVTSDNEGEELRSRVTCWVSAIAGWSC